MSNTLERYKYNKGGELDMVNSIGMYESTATDRVNIIFLDIDGVLNGYGPSIDIWYKLLDRLHLVKWWKSWYDVFGIRTWKVFLLWIIVKATKSKVVLSSSWRSGWYKPYDECSDRMKSLKDKLSFFKIDVIGVTPKHTSSNRSKEIITWLDRNSSIVNRFIVLDDESFDLQVFLSKELILTSKNGKITGSVYDGAGLKIKHVVQAIKILNKQK